MRASHLRGRVLPAPDRYHPDLWSKITDAFEEVGLGACISQGDDLTGEIVFDCLGEKHSDFISEYSGFSVTLAHVFSNLADLKYTGSFCLESGRSCFGAVITKILEVIDSQVFNSENNILYMVCPPQQGLEKITTH